jgi:hypothetical protein
MTSSDPKLMPAIRPIPKNPRGSRDRRRYRLAQYVTRALDDLHLQALDLESRGRRGESWAQRLGRRFKRGKKR